MISKLKPEILAKLPKWAQQHITLMENDRDYWKKLAQQGNVEDSNVTYDKAVFETFGLPRDTRIKFLLESSPRFDRSTYIEVYHARGWGSKIDRSHIEIRSGLGTLLIQPAVSNAVFIGVADH